MYNLKDNKETYQPAKEETSSFLSHPKLPRLSPDHVSKISTPIQPEDILKVLESFKALKFPRSDGLFNGYDQKYADIISLHRILAFSKAADEGSFPIKTLKAQIITLPKLCKDPMSPPSFAVSHFLGRCKTFIQHARNAYSRSDWTRPSWFCAG